MDDEDFEFVECYQPSMPLRWQSVAAVFFGGVQGVLEEVSGVFAGLSGLMAADANYRTDRDQFRQEAAVELETILEEGE